MENDISEMNKYNSNINEDKKLDFKLSDSITKKLDFKLNDSLSNNSRFSNKNSKNINSLNDKSNSKISPLNQSYQNFFKINKTKNMNNNNKRNEYLKLSQTKSFLSKKNNKNNLYYMNNTKSNNVINPSSLTYYGSFNFKPSKLINTKKNKKEKESFNDFYNYGEYLTQELKMSNDTNIEILEKYVKLKTELRNKENEIKEIEEKLKVLKEKEIEIDKSNTELNKNISNVQNILNNNKLSSDKSFSEIENEITSDQNKIEELNNMNSNLLTIQREYKNGIN